jgi:putative MFS transporter
MQMASTSIGSPAAEITARLDRLPMTRHMWMLVLLISLGGWFDTYAIFLTGSIAPGLFAGKIFTPASVSLFGLTGLASFIAALFTGLFIGTMFFTQAAGPVRPEDGLHLLARVVLHRHADHGVPVHPGAASIFGA